MKHVDPKTISSKSHKLKNTIPSKEAKDSSQVNEAYLEHHPHRGGEDSSPKDPSIFKQYPVWK